ncbi:hypothetical protein [Thalassobacillus sp. CUG 92003]|uniref:hypothetical protein n=1 Tax=Thalassobacillus sp. CUG 92003 TaxID=2736641 RepID=UPI0015E7426C|nr:hypothetical protein [Thalassobacillus sp. CUG 92003]
MRELPKVELTSEYAGSLVVIAADGYTIRGKLEAVFEGHILLNVEGMLMQIRKAGIVGVGLM